MTQTEARREADTNKIAKHSLLFLAGTGLSRVSGLLRDMAMALAFGTSAELAAFMVAFRFSNLLRRLLSESALSSCFIPQFEKICAEDEGGGRTFFRDFLATLLIILLVTLILTQAVLTLAAKWALSYRPILDLTKLMMPGLFFISLYGLTTALLQCRQRFFLAALAPIAFNLTWALGALGLGQSSAPFGKMAWCVVAAYAGQWLMTMPPVLSWMREKGGHFWRAPHPFSPQVRAVARPFLLGIIGLGASQINAFIDVLFARAASLEGPAYLWYAIRLQQLPLALFGVGLASALLPPLARAVKRGDQHEGEQLLRYCLKRTYALLLPATLGLLLVGKSVIALLFGYGHFDLVSVDETARSLFGYAWGLVPMGWTLILAPLFYAQGDYRTPMRGALLTLVLNALLNAIFIFGFHMGAESVAYATSLSALANALYLKRCWGGGFEMKGVLKITLCALIATLAALKGHFALQIALFTGIYFLMGYLMKVREIGDLLKGK